MGNWNRDADTQGGTSTACDDLPPYHSGLTSALISVARMAAWAGFSSSAPPAASTLVPQFPIVADCYGVKKTVGVICQGDFGEKEGPGDSGRWEGRYLILDSELARWER